MTGGEGHTFDNANRIATRQVGTSMAQNYGSDADGNTTSDGKRSMAWDSQNRLIENYLSGGGTADQHVSRFKYGADGLRRRMITYTLPYYEDEGDTLGVPSNGGRSEYKPANATITHYGYDGTNAVREWSEDPLTQVKTIAATYLLGPSGPMYKRPANAADVRWYVYDGLGSVVGEVDVNGTLLCQKKTDVYGINRGNVGTALSRHGFVGGLGHYSDDETGLIYMRARYYDPATGRFISEDPAKDGMNWFSYCGNDPLNKSDRSGCVPESSYEWGLFGSAAGYAAFALGGNIAYGTVFATPANTVLALALAFTAVFCFIKALDPVIDGRAIWGTLGFAVSIGSWAGSAIYAEVIQSTMATESIGTRITARIAAPATMAIGVYTLECIAGLIAIELIG